MRVRSVSLTGHLTLLILFCIAVVGVWMLPLLLAGFPFWISEYVPDTRAFVETGVMDMAIAPLSILIVRTFHLLIAWQDMMGWAALSAAFSAAALIPLWWSAYRLFDTRIAWLTTVLLSFMPLYWMEAVRFGGYSFAFFFLFLGFALFLELQAQRRLLAVVLAGLCFGATIASHHAFVALLPWMVLAYLWQRRAQWKRALVEAALYCICAYMASVLPFLPNALQGGMSPMQRIAIFLPTTESHYTGLMHLYPDEFTYQFYKEEFEARSLQRSGTGSFLARQFDRNYRINFGVEQVGFFGSLLNGLWLFANILPNLFSQETVGGAFLWLFILPGAAYLFHQRKRFLIQLVGLWFSMELIVRFVLHFSRDHLMDVGWIPALLAAVGVVSIGTAVSQHSKKISLTTLSILMVLLMSAQMVQANRKLFARLYEKSAVPGVYAAEQVLESTPPHAVIAHPKKDILFYFSDRARVNIHSDTVAYLKEKGKLSEPFKYYGVTHIIGYSDEQAAAIKKAVPSIQILQPKSVDMPVQITPFIQWVLHIVR